MNTRALLKTVPDRQIYVGRLGQAMRLGTLGAAATVGAVNLYLLQDLLVNPPRLDVYAIIIVASLIATTCAAAVFAWWSARGICIDVTGAPLTGRDADRDARFRARLTPDDREAWATYFTDVARAARVRRGLPASGVQ